MILHDPGELSVITRVLKSGRRKEKSQGQRMQCGKDWLGFVGWEAGGRGCVQPPKAGNDKGMDSPLELLEGTSPANILISVQ